jgi:phospholipid/cholesterol/gamma-HCH transport system permease protein
VARYRPLAEEFMNYSHLSIEGVRRLGAWTIGLVQTLGHLALFCVQGLAHLFTGRFVLKKVLQQVYFIGAKSVFVICLTGAFTGMVLGLQGYYVLVKYGSAGSLGAAVALTLVREMGPVLTAIMITARAGSAMAAEIGIMRISEQIDALETMTINPVAYLFSPRVAAALISFPLLTALFDTIGILGGYLTGSVLLGLSSGIYFDRVESSVMMTDINGGFLKALVFAMVVITICCYHGYHTHLRADAKGAEGVSFSTTSAVVHSCVMILVTDYVLTSFLL